MAQKLSFNIHGYNVQDKNKLLTWVRDHNPPVALVLNNKDLASEIADLGVPLVVLRITNNDDEIQNKIGSFREWWDAVKSQYTDKRLLVHFCNEPHSNYAKLASLIIEGVQILKAEGLRGVFGNWSVGMPEVNDWKTTLAPAIKAVKDAGMFIGLHEYLMYTTDASVPYYINRLKDLDFPIIITEFGTDFIQQLFNKYGIDKFNGFKTYNNQDLVVDNLKQAVNLYNANPNVLGVCFFCYGNSGGWDNFNAENFPRLFDRMSEFKELEMLTIKAKVGSVNRRLLPNTTAPIQGVLTTPVAVTQTAHVDGWTQYQFPDGNFWLSDAFVVIVPDLTVQIQLIDATNDDVAAFKNAVQTITDLAAKYKIQFLDS